jgi:hypothetical protein
MATCLREAAPAKAGNAAGGFFQHSPIGSLTKTKNSLSLNLETAVGSQKSTQVLGAPRKIKKCLITHKVTTIFFHHAHQSLTRLFCALLPFLG